MAADRFEHHARLTSILTLASRVTGLVRDGALARVFGVGPLMDAFTFAFLIPNLFRRLFGEGAISSAFVPRYAGLVRDDPELARRYAGRMLAFLAVLLWGLVLVGEAGLLVAWLNAPEVVYDLTSPVRHGAALVPGVSVRYPRLAFELAALMLPYMPLVCLVAVGGSALQVHGRFGPTAASPIILNLAFIAATLGLAPSVLGASLDAAWHVRIVAASVTVAGVLQLAWTLRVLRVARPLPGRDDPRAGQGVRATFVETLPMMLGLGVLQLNTMVDGLIASWPTIVGPTILGFRYPLAEGAMTAIANAQRLYEFPLGVFGISIATAVFPLLARQSNDPAAFAATVRRALRLTVFIGLPASAGLVLAARDSVGTLFQGGEFGPDDTERVAWILVGYAPAIWSYQMAHVLTRAFYARKEPMTPVLVSVGMVALNLTLNLTLIFTPLREAGLAWSTAACSVIQSAILVVLLARRVPGIFGREVAAGWLRCVAATAAMTLALLAIGPLLPAGDAWRGLLIALLAKVAVGLVAYLAAARLLGMPELAWTLHRGRAPKE